MSQRQNDVVALSTADPEPLQSHQSCDMLPTNIESNPPISFQGTTGTHCVKKKSSTKKNLNHTVKILHFNNLFKPCIAELLMRRTMTCFNNISD